MKLPRRSLAYGWALSQLHRRHSRYPEAVAFAFALAMFILAFVDQPHARQHWAFCAVFLIGAIAAWERRGFTEVFEEQQRLIDEARDRERRKSTSAG